MCTAENCQRIIYPDVPTDALASDSNYRNFPGEKGGEGVDKANFFSATDKS